MSLCILARASVVVLPPDDVETRNRFSLGIHVAFHGAAAGQANANIVFLH